MKNKKMMAFLLAGILLIGIGVMALLYRRTEPSGESDGTVEESDDATEESDSGEKESPSFVETEGDPMEITHYAEITIQDYGTITVALYGNAAPITVENFVALAEDGFYDGLTFHRIWKGFMMQGGDPLGNGTGGSGKTIVGEFSDNGIENVLSHTRGAISMARSQKYDSASSQFFIVHEDSTGLDGQYAVFGYVTDGMDVVDAVCEDAKPIDGNRMIASEQQPVITSIVIVMPEK